MCLSATENSSIIAPETQPAHIVIPKPFLLVDKSKGRHWLQTWNMRNQPAFQINDTNTKSERLAYPFSARQSSNRSL